MPKTLGLQTLGLHHAEGLLYSPKVKANRLQGVLEVPLQKEKGQKEVGIKAQLPPARA